VVHARKEGLTIKQSYERVGRLLVMKASRYAHARQMRRSRAATRKLRTALGRVIREVERQAGAPALSRLLTVCKRIHSQKPHDNEKIYSVHEPEVMCIAKGKAGKKYEFGQKVSVAVTSKGGWIIGAKCMPDNPYDGHTLKDQIEQMGRAVRGGHVAKWSLKKRRRIGWVGSWLLVYCTCARSETGGSLRKFAFPYGTSFVASLTAYVVRS
jgi:IS5 family transposase